MIAEIEKLSNSSIIIMKNLKRQSNNTSICILKKIL
jgi:hypothetical protein